MASVLTDGPVLNKRIKDFFSGLLPNMFGSAGESQTTYTILLTMGILLATLGLFIWYFKIHKRLETPYNIQQLVKAGVRQADTVSKQYNTSIQRKDLRSYLIDQQKTGVPAKHMALTNFYVNTVNGAGLFYPATDGVMSPVAAQMAVSAGARGFIFDIWPNLEPGGNFGPSLQVVEQGTLWRRITLNAVSFASVLNTIVNEVFLPYPNDIIYLYLRFRGSPRYSTFDGTMNALRGNIEQYRLDASFNACRGQERLFKTPITQLFGRVIVLSNLKARGTPLEDYINSSPLQGIQTDWAPQNIRALTETMIGEQKKNIQQNLTVAALPLEDPKAETNSWEWKTAANLGVHLIGMNLLFKNDQLDSYRGSNMFGSSSYVLKPENLRYELDIIEAPGRPEDPQWEGENGKGSLRFVEPIRTGI